MNPDEDKMTLEFEPDPLQDQLDEVFAMAAAAVTSVMGSDAAPQAVRELQDVRRETYKRLGFLVGP